MLVQRALSLVFLRSLDVNKPSAMLAGVNSSRGDKQTGVLVTFYIR
jgi:hypothetical protein